MSTRILSAFSLLKRVGFALLILILSVFNKQSALAQGFEPLWSTTVFHEYTNKAVGVFSFGDSLVVFGSVGLEGGVRRLALVTLDLNGTISDTIVLETNALEAPNKVIATNRGTFVIIGRAFWDEDPLTTGFALETTVDGNILWHSQFSAELGTGHELRSGCQLIDGSYVFVGWAQVARNPGSDLGYWIVSVDSLGQSISDTLLTFGDSSSKRANSVIGTSDGGYIVGGEFDCCNAQVLKFTASHDLVWSTWIETSDIDATVSELLLLEDGDVVSVGTASEDRSNPDQDIFVVKLDEFGEVLWSAKPHIQRSQRCEFGIITQSGNILAGGYSLDPTVQGDKFALLSISPLGVARQVVSREIQDEPGVNFDEQVYDAIELMDSSIIVVGASVSTDPGFHPITFLISQLSAEDYQESLLEGSIQLLIPTISDTISSVHVLFDWTPVFDTDIYDTVLYDLNILLEDTIVRHSTMDNSFTLDFSFITETITSIRWYISAHSYLPPCSLFSDTAMFVYLQPLDVSRFQERSHQDIFRISPNPANGIVNIEFLGAFDKSSLTLFNINGQVVLSNNSFRVNPTSQSICLDTKDLPSGTYFLFLKRFEMNEAHKLQIVK